MIKQYDTHSVLNGVSLAVEPDEVVTVLGSSGSGKSTFMHLINQSELLNGSEIFTDGKSISQLCGATLCQLCSRIGFVFQQFNLYPRLATLQNIVLVLEYVHDWNKTGAERRILGLLEKVGLTEKANAHATQLSGGQQQYVVVARILAPPSRIILSDEPTSALDPEMIGEVLQVMKNLAHSDIAMIAMTHETHFAHEIVDRVAFIDGSDIFEVALSEDSFARPQHPRTQRFPKRVLDLLHQGSSS